MEEIVAKLSSAFAQRMAEYVESSEDGVLNVKLEDREVRGTKKKVLIRTGDGHCRRILFLSQNPPNVCWRESY